MWDLANSMWDLANSSAQLFGLGLGSGSALSLRFGVGLKSFCHSIRHCSSSLAWRHGFLTRRCPLERAAGRGRGCCPLAGLLSHSLVRRILHLVKSVWERQGWERQGFQFGCDGCDSPALCNRSLNSRVPAWMSPLEKSTLKYLGALQCCLLLQLPGCWIWALLSAIIAVCSVRARVEWRGWGSTAMKWRWRLCKQACWTSRSSHPIDTDLLGAGWPPLKPPLWTLWWLHTVAPGLELALELSSHRRRFSVHRRLSGFLNSRNVSLCL